jgi:hypothetical protein
VVLRYFLMSCFRGSLTGQSRVGGSNWFIVSQLSRLRATTLYPRGHGGCKTCSEELVCSGKEVVSLLLTITMLLEGKAELYTGMAIAL